MASKPIDTYTHEGARRANIPTAEMEGVVRPEVAEAVRVAYERWNADLDPQLVWRGKAVVDPADLVVNAPPLFIQEKVHPKVLIDDLMKERDRRARAAAARARAAPSAPSGGGATPSPSSRGGAADEAIQGGGHDAGDGARGPGSPRFARDDGGEWRDDGGSARDDGGGRRVDGGRGRDDPEQIDLFADFDGIDDPAGRTAEFYRHGMNWTNRMILGDSLAVMASLAEREGLRGKVQCIYLDPPYGIRFNSNFQWSTTSRDVKDGKLDHVTREPEQVKAFRDTWRDGIHSYLSYLRDRLTVARDLLADTGSIFVQIGDENVHRVRAVMDEVFGEENFCSLVTVAKTTGAGSPAIGTRVLAAINDYIIWYARDNERVKYRQIYTKRTFGAEGASQYNLVETEDAGLVRSMTANERAAPEKINEGWRIIAHDNFTSQSSTETTQQPVDIYGISFRPGKGGWKTNALGASRLKKSSRFMPIGRTLRYKRRFHDFGAIPTNNSWLDFRTSGFSDTKLYVVQTNPGVIERCILMTTDPGDLVLDPTCGSGTTATVAEQWGRRWITIDTSRVALALARSRIMGARYPYYLLADSPEGQAKEAEVSRTAPSTRPTSGDIRHGFVYQRVPHITLKSIANNAEIDVIWERMQPAVEEARADLNAALAGHDTPFPVATGGRAGKTVDFREDGEETLPSGEPAPKNALLEWEVPREAPEDWPETARLALERFWEARIARQREIDASIAAKAEQEFLYDKPYEDKSRIRVAGPFTVESLSPHRVLAVDEDTETGFAEVSDGFRHDGAPPERDFAAMILENLRAAGVQQADKGDRIAFTSLVGWPGEMICAEGRYTEGEDGPERRAGILVGPEFGTVSRQDLVVAAREAADAGFDVLIACAFAYDAQAADLSKLGRIPILKARMNPDLHMSADLAANGKGNLFVVFGEPDVAIEPAGPDAIRVRIEGVDVFKPQTGEVVSEGPDNIALWMIDTDYDEESFFVRHAYFLGAGDPYKALKTSLKAEIDEEAWSTLNSDVSRPFPRPPRGRIAVKVINHLGDEVMKVFRV